MTEPTNQQHDYLIVLHNNWVLAARLTSDAASQLSSDWAAGCERGAYAAIDASGEPFTLCLRLDNVVAITASRLVLRPEAEITATAILTTSALHD